MAVVPDKRRFQKGNIGVVNSNAGGQNVWEGVANLASTVSKNEFEINAEKAKQSGFDLASEMDRSKIISIDPDTGKPVALSFTKGFGRIQEATYNDVIYKRFQNHMKDEILNVSADVAKRSGYNPDVYARNMGDYLDSMDKASKGRYKGYIADTGFEVISKTSENLRVKAQSAAIASAKKAAESNADTALDDLMDAAIVASQPGMSLVNYSDATDPRKPLERIDLGAGSGVRYFERNAGFYSYGNAVKAFTVSMNEELTITGDAKKYVARKNSLSESFGHVAFSYVNDSFVKSSELDRGRIKEAINNPLMVNQINDPYLKAYISTMHDRLDQKTLSAMESQLTNSNTFLTQQEVASLKARNRSLENSISSPLVAFRNLTDPDADEGLKSASLNYFDTELVRLFQDLPVNKVAGEIELVKNALLTQSIYDSLSAPIKSLLMVTASLPYKYRKDLYDRLNVEADALNAPTIHRQKIKEYNLDYISGRAIVLWNKIDGIKVTQSNEGRGLYPDEIAFIAAAHDEMLSYFSGQPIVDSGGHIDVARPVVSMEDFSADIGGKIEALTDGRISAVTDKVTRDAAEKKTKADKEEASSTAFKVLMNLPQEIERIELVKTNPSEALLRIKTALNQLNANPDISTSNFNTVHNSLIALRKDAQNKLGQDVEASQIENAISAISGLKTVSPSNRNELYNTASTQISEIIGKENQNGLQTSLDSTYNKLVISGFVQSMTEAGLVVGSIDAGIFESMLTSLTGDSASLIEMSDQEILIYNNLKAQVDSLKGDTDSAVRTWATGVKEIYKDESARVETRIKLSIATASIASGAATLEQKKMFVENLPPQINNLTVLGLFNKDGTPNPNFGDVSSLARYGLAPVGIQSDIWLVGSGKSRNDTVTTTVLNMIISNPDLAAYAGENAERLLNAAFRLKAGEDVAGIFADGSFKAASDFMKENYPPEAYPKMSAEMRSYVLNIASLYKEPTKEKIEAYINDKTAGQDDLRVWNGRASDSGTSVDGYRGLIGTKVDVQSREFPSVFSRPLSERERYIMNVDINNALVEAYPLLVDTGKFPLDRNMDSMSSFIALVVGEHAITASRSQIDWGLEYSENTGLYTVVFTDTYGKRTVARNKDGSRITVSNEDYAKSKEQESNLVGIYYRRFVQQAASDSLTATRPYGTSIGDLQSSDVLSGSFKMQPEHFSNPVTQGMSDAAYFALAVNSHPQLFQEQAMAALLRQRIREGYILQAENLGVSDAMEFYLRGGLTLEEYNKDKANGFAALDGDKEAMSEHLGRNRQEDLDKAGAEALKPFTDSMRTLIDGVGKGIDWQRESLGELYSGTGEVLAVANATQKAALNQIYSDGLKVWEEAVKFDTRVGDAVDEKVGEIFAKAVAFDTAVGDAVDAKVLEVWEKAAAFDKSVGDAVDEKAREIWEASGGDAVLQAYNDSKSKAQARREGGPPPPDGKNKGREIPAAIDSFVEWWNDRKITSQHRRLLQKHPEAVTYRTREDYEAAVSRGMVSDGAEVIVGLDYFIHSGGR